VEVDVPGAALCVAGLGAVVFGLIEEPRRGLDPAVSACLAGGVALLAAFVVWERRARRPMLELRLFRRRNFSVTNIETLAVWGGLSAFSFFLPVYLQQLGGYTPFRAGLATFPVTLVLFALSRYAGRFSVRFGPRWFMGIGPIVAGGALAFLARLPARLDYWTDLLPPLTGFAIGLAATVAPVTTTVLTDAGPGDAGIASGINNAVARIGGLVAIAAIGIAASGGTARLTLHGFHLAMLLTAGLICLGGAVGGALVR
jgi:predicted MFS family arabinose efflux permease